MNKKPIAKTGTTPGSGARKGGGRRSLERDTGPRTDGDGGKLGARRPGSMAPRQRGDGGGKHKQRGK